MADVDFVYVDICYCSLCDRYFPDVDARAEHIQYTTNHPKCNKCGIRFANGNALRNHYVVSRRHHCSVCRLEFKTAAGFRAHVEFASVHRDDSDDEDEDGDIDDSYDGWEDDVGRSYFPEENDSEEPLVEDDDSVTPENEYWDEDDELPVGEESYRGWARVPSAAPVRQEFESDTRLHAEHPTVAPDTEAAAEQALQPAAEELDGPNRGKDDPSASAPSAPATLSTAAPCNIVFVGCPLCLEPAAQPTVTRCGHVFCGPCIHQALDTKRNCPVCRVPAGHKQLRKIFFTTPAAPVA